jgi:hypothetical protein
MWRSRHLRNDAIQQDGKETIEHSSAFLESYVWCSMLPKPNLCRRPQRRNPSVCCRPEDPREAVLHRWGFLVRTSWKLGEIRMHPSLEKINPEALAWSLAWNTKHCIDREDCSKAWVTTISYWSLSAPPPQGHQNDFSSQIQTVEHLRCDQGLAQSLSWLSQHCVNFGEKRV